MEKSTVVLIPCADYDKERVYRSIKAGVDAVGGIGAFVKPSERILVKPNFLYPSDADRCVTTHPAVISAVCRLLREANMGSVSVGDSPANGNCAGAVKKLSLDEADLFGASVAEMTDEVTVDYPEGRACKRFRFAREVTEADAIIGLCKMKTHMLEHITGAVKNMYGLIAGYRKAVIDAEKCIRCGLCVEHCPVEGKAIAFDNGRDKPPVYRYKKCIRCYCCQELCPGHAIRVK